MITKTDNPQRKTAVRRRLVQRGARGAFTLIELMVSVSVLAGLMLGFSMVLTQSQRVVTGAQGMMRANNKAATIAEVIRQDLRKVSKNGFFYADSSHLVFTTAGPSPSMIDAGVGSGSLVSYVCSNNILYRQRWVLASSGTSEDIYRIGNNNVDFADIQIRSAMNKINNNIATDIVSKAKLLETVVELPPEPGNVNDLWRVLATGCSVFKIEYAQSAAGGGVNWDSGGGLWTVGEQGHWPVLVKIKFTIQDKDIAKIFGQEEGQDKADYEVICPVGH